MMQAHLRQMQSCVRTEEGIMTSSPIFSNFAGKECEDIVALGNINTSIQKALINLDEAIEKNPQYSSLQKVVQRIH